MHKAMAMQTIRRGQTSAGYPSFGPLAAKNVHLMTEGEIL